jgi:ribonucleoside-diphosphate reductase beta chain
MATRVETEQQSGQRSAAWGNSTMAEALRRMADSEPELAARLVVQSLPVAAAPLPADLSWRLEVDGVGAWEVTGNGNGGAALVEPVDGANGHGDFSLETDPAGLASLAAGASPLGLILRRRMRLRGKRRKALALRAMDPEAGPGELVRLGLPIDPDLLYRSLAYAFEPEWTRGERFAIAFELYGEEGGRWVVAVDDGEVGVRREALGDATQAPEAGTNGFGPAVGTIVRVSVETWRRLLSGELSPTAAAELGLTQIEGELHPATLFGRWADRAAGVDGPELERETRQREVQQRRAGAWGSAGNGRAPADDTLMSYEQLYALWEQRNWRAHELDFSVDQEQWLAASTESQRETAWSMSNFYVGEERVAADLAPFVLAAPSGEAEAFLATQLVDEIRHAVFFDRWGAEVMALSGDHMRSRLEGAEATMAGAWHFVFDDGLRDVAQRLQKRPDDLGLFVEGIVIYHMVTEGVLAMTGQRSILDYLGKHSLYPGFQQGFTLVEQDEHRHIAFGVRFLRDVVRERPEMREVIVSTLTRLLPEAAKVFCPVGQDPRSFMSYDYSSEQIYGFAYMALKRRMDIVGVEIPPGEELMPGPIDPRGFEQPFELPVDVAGAATR